jgi:hypothetical protein
MNTKKKLIKTTKKLLSAEDLNLDFLIKLQEDELKVLVASIRDRLDNQEQ